MAITSNLLYLCLVVCLSLGQDNLEVCKTSYDQGFYDPCFDTECNFSCPGNTKQVTVADPGSCFSYFLCQNNRLLPQKCPDGKKFNYIFHGCYTDIEVYNKCQPLCPLIKGNVYKNFIDNPTTLETTIIPTTTIIAITTHLILENSTKISITSSISEINSIVSKSSQGEKTSAVDELYGYITSPITPDSILSRVQPSTLLNTGSCLNLKSNITNETDYITLTCHLSCILDAIPFDLKFFWFKDNNLLLNLTNNNKEMLIGHDDDGVRVSFTAGNNGFMSSFLQINKSEDYTGIYYCMISSKNINLEYQSDYLPVAPELTLRITQTHLDKSTISLTCGVYTVDEGPVPMVFCMGGRLKWEVKDREGVTREEYKSGTCHDIIKIDDNTTMNVTCEWSHSSYEIFLKTLLIISTEVEEVTCPLIYDDYNLIWIEVQVHNTSKQLCPGSTQAYAMKSCVMNDMNEPYWLSTDFSECIDEGFVIILKKLKALEFETSDDQTSFVIADLTNNLFDLTSMKDLTLRNLNTTIQCIQLLTTIRSSKDHRFQVHQKEVWAVMEIVSNILKKSNMDSWAILREHNADIATTVVRAVDLYLVQIEPETEKTFFDSNLEIQSRIIVENNYPNNVVEIQPQQPEFGWIGNTKIENPFNNISLSMDFFKSKYHHGDDGGDESQNNPVLPPVAALYTAIYTNLENILQTHNGSYLASKIMVIKTSIDGLLSWVNGGINITFAHTKKNDSAKFIPSCVFWNFSLGQNGQWSSVGCRVVWTNENATTCSCDHMTNFAILMSIDQEALVDNVAIRLISLVGCIISIVCLIITIIILASSWRLITDSTRRTKMSHHYAILINLCAALVIANAVFIGGIDKTQPRELCIVIATLLHFFFMAAFFLMLAEGVQLLLYVVHVFHVPRRIETAAIITLAWVLAGIVVGISLAVTKTEGYGTSKHCWLSSSQGLVWAFIGPALLIIFINLFILFIVLYKASRSKITSDKLNIKDQIKRTIWNMVVISPLLGITWVFGVLSVSESLDAFQYIFAVVNSLQGFFIFLFHGLYNQIRLRKSGNVLNKKKNKQQMKVDINRLNNNNSMENNYSCHISSEDYSFEVKNTAIFSEDRHHNLDNHNPHQDMEGVSAFKDIYGSQSTESSYVETGSQTSQ